MGDRAIKATISQNKIKNREGKLWRTTIYVASFRQLNVLLLVLADLDRCYKWVTEFAESTTATKQVKWLISSDDESIRNHYKKNFPNRTITLDHSVNHISEVTKRRVDEVHKFLMLKNLFAEWFIIGSADSLITNNVHNFGVSSFSRSAWLYNLKSRYYELRSGSVFCFKREYSFQGNTGTVSKECSTANPLLSKDIPPFDALPQLHWPQGKNSRG